MSSYDETERCSVFPPESYFFFPRFPNAKFWSSKSMGEPAKLNGVVW